MNSIGLIASVVVGLAFVVAGASKIAAGPLWPQQARDLGAPSWTIPVVPWLEVSLGAALVVGLLRPWPAVGAAAVLVAFTVLLVVRLSQGRRPPCACFGAWSATPIGPGHVARNVVLLALAVAATAA